MPRARISGTGATPEPSFRFEPGQCITLTSCSASSCLLALVHPDAVRGAQARRRQAQAARDTRGCVRPPDSCRTIAISSRDSDACVCTSASLLDPTGCATASSSSREHETANRGANAARSRPFAAPSHRARIARLSSIDAASSSCSRCGTSRVEVHHALADRRPHPALRRPLRTRHRCRAPSPSSAPRSCRSTSSSVVASRAAARSVSGVCAASIGQTRVRSQSISGRSSA